MKVFSTLILGLFATLLFSQSETKKQIAFSHLSIEQGLSQNSVISIAQDSIGYMWFATQDGLNRYDGNGFKVYNKQFEDITRPRFSKLGKVYIDQQNRLWIITNSGNLELYNAESDSFEAMKLFKNVSSIFQDKNLNLYIGTYGNGLYKIDHKSKETLQIFKEEDYKKTVYDFFEDHNTIIMAASNAVFKLNDNSYTPFDLQNKSTNYSSIVSAKDGTLWFGTYGNGLFYKKSGSNEVLSFKNDLFPDNLSSLNIEDLLIDNQERLWIASYGNGAYIIDFKNNTIENFLENKTDPFAIHYNDMLALYQDNTGVVWLGSDGAGASYYDEHLVKFNVLTTKQMPKAVNIDVVRSIVTDVNENMWIGTSGKGLTFIDTKNDVYETFSSNNLGLSSNRIISLSYQDEELWIGHQGYGLDILTSNNKIKSFPEISNYTVWRIVSQSKNASWLCTENQGLILFDKNKGIQEHYNTSNSGLTSNNIKTVEKENDNILWIGTEGDGVFRLDRVTQTITKIEGLEDPIKSLLFREGTLCIGTFGKGLKRYNTKTKETVTFTIEDGLPNNVIYGILPDDNGNLWLSTNIGLSKLSIKKDLNSPTIENYNNYDGLQALEFNTGAYYKSTNGTLYFGGLDGVNWFHPDQLTQNTVKPKTVISGLSLFNKPIEKIDNKQFKHSENTITFTFSSLHFSQPERNQFKYKLVNNDNDWIEAGNNHIAHYTNLPPNDYQFQVKSSNYDGIWNESPAIYNFRILKPWYLTNLAKVSYLVLFLLIIYLIYTYFKARLKMKMQLRLEHEETVRLKQLDEFKTKLYTNISHEFRTPLTLISGPVENQLNRTTLTKEDKQELGLVKRSAKRLLNLVNQMLDLSKLESGNLQLQVAQGDLSILLKQIAKTFQYKAKDKNIDFSYKIQPTKNAWFDKDVIEKIVSNLLSNAVKYAPNNGYIYFEANTQNERIIINILNNGNTLSNEDIPKLFKRYYQTSRENDGVGIGLSLVKELTALSHGNIIASLINEDDIQFTVTLPIERDYFNSKEVAPINIKKDQPEARTDSHIEDLPETLLSSKKPILLIVEDEEDIRQFVKSIFKNTYKIIEAPNGEAGLNRALQYIPDIIISDVMMPKMSGFQLCDNLKQDQRTSHIPIILLTAKSGDQNEIKGLKTGADAYITKPFNSEKLKLRAAQLIALRRELQNRYGNSFNLNDSINTSADEQFTKKIREVLKDNLMQSGFKAESLSDKMHMNRMQLHRKLKALTGLTASEFIRNERLKIAKKLVVETDLTTSEIAYQVGFNSPSYFTKCFRQAYKITPIQYRESL